MTQSRSKKLPNVPSEILENPREYAAAAAATAAAAAAAG